MLVLTGRRAKCAAGRRRHPTVLARGGRAGPAASPVAEAPPLLRADALSSCACRSRTRIRAAALRQVMCKGGISHYEVCEAWQWGRPSAVTLAIMPQGADPMPTAHIMQTVFQAVSHSGWRAASVAISRACVSRQICTRRIAVKALLRFCMTNLLRHW